jgi:hypothetical protein
MDVEGIGKTHKEVEERPIVNGLRDLGVGPPDLTQLLDLLVRNPVGMPCERLNKLKKQPVLGRKLGRIEVTVAQGGGGLRILFTLQLQEPRMAAESIVAAVQRRDIGGNHFVLGTCQRSVREMHLARLIDGAKKIGAQTHRPQDVRNGPAFRPPLQLLVQAGQLTGCGVILDPRYPRHIAPPSSGIVL